MTLSTVSIVSAKSYSFSLATPMQAGSAQLAPGDYKLEIEGSNAILTDKKTRKSVTVPVKVEETSTKYDSTSLDSSSAGGTAQITAIKLGGSKTKIEFSK